MKQQIDFRPMQGLMHLGKLLAHRVGLGGLWDGEEGIEGALNQKLKDLGVPSQPIPLTGEKALTPRQFAEHAGFIRKRRRIAKA